MAASLCAILIGVILDLLIGDPHWMFFHPIRLMGKLITVCEKKTRAWFPKTKTGERIAGVITVVIVAGVSFFLPFFVLRLCYRTATGLGVAVAGIGCYFLLAAKSLRTESMRVYEPLQQGDVEHARVAVSMIVGRDVEHLTKEGITKAAVETVAENTSDGVIAPLFYMVLLGPSVAFFYKAVNTMDSMLGYKNERYLYYGRCAARLDDVVNYIPARISAWLMIVVAYFLPGLDGRNAYFIYRRDRRKHASPNSAQTEAVCAGALRVQLAGDAWYFGKRYHKPTIGDALEPVEPEKIKEANRLMYGTALLALLIFMLCRVGIFMLLNR